jgi:hypothetical protein
MYLGQNKDCFFEKVAYIKKNQIWKSSTYKKKLKNNAAQKIQQFPPTIF